MCRIFHNVDVIDVLTPFLCVLYFQKAEDAEIVGLLLGSMGLETHVTQQALHILRQQCTAAGKKVYTFTMGKINEAKLSNFGEVNKACTFATQWTAKGFIGLFSVGFHRWMYIV